ncbi:MAG: translation initiation factor IF-2 [Patescibacteria group bacterium]|nr:translation initiation factor IF-2 [Patescibacteria group bacterium]MDE1967196.1 translation initiation factor IF-2 [Patescibacteria group bacterium]
MSASNQKNLVPSSGASVKRPPVVVVMGHIDHGKSTLLDYIRKSNVVAKEAGGITQHVGAYQAEYQSTDGKAHKITFLDTPGHAAFTGIRERGAQAADVAILVVSAEDGVKPQTIEAFKQIQRSKIPFIVAITKIDKPNANIDKAKTSLGENEIYVEGWGGDVPCVPISAATGENIPELLDMIMLVSELADLKADDGLSASGIVIESSLDTRKGVSATLLIKNGRLETGNFVVAGSSFAPVRFIEDFAGKKIESASASMPVRIIGWNEIPPAGEAFATVTNKKSAEKMAEEARSAQKEEKRKDVQNVAQATKAADKLKPEEKEAPTVVSLPIMIKADVIGSLEGVKFELSKIAHDKVRLDVVSEGIGDINENDIKLAESDPRIMIVGFNVEADKKAAAMIERAPAPLQVRTFKIIYELVQHVQDALLAKVPKEYVEEVTGRAKILALFAKDKDRQVVGGKVETGILESGNDVRIMRREAEIGRGKIRELQSKKVRVSEVAQGFEFGMMVEAKIEIAVGDRIESVRTVEKS